MMTEDEIFELAIKMREQDVPDLLDRVCQHQPAWRERLEKLIAAHRQSNFLDYPLPETSIGLTSDADRKSQFAATTIEPTRLSAGTVLGPYTLECLLGEGGMGEVWIAKQTEPVKRRVAIKMIKHGKNSREILNRFDHERQTLAVMDHPNIARVLDANITPDGRPYFAMELVNGLPLTRFCDEAKLSTEQRLQIFLQICAAVQHAHQKGVIHRDLKPANILVTMIDGKPSPKVIDFGVSKAVGNDLKDGSPTTQFGMILGTFEYMSPEQAGYSGNDIDTRADIYALGVILYELLTGLKPLDMRQIRENALHEIMRMIRDEEPSKPSDRFSTSESSPTLAAARSTDPQRLSRSLRGDLDWIVLKCLEKDRNRRYETTNQLAMEIRRYLADEPVLAGPPSRAYLLRKYLKRNRTTVVALLAVFVALLSGLAASLWQMNRAMRAEQAATKSEIAEKKQRELAEMNAALAAEGNRQAREALDAVTDDVIGRLFRKSGRLSDAERAFLKRVLASYERLGKLEGDSQSSLELRLQAYWRVTGIQKHLAAYRDAADAFAKMQPLVEQLIKLQPGEASPRFQQVRSLREAAECSEKADDLAGWERFLSQAELLSVKLAADFPDDPEIALYNLIYPFDRARRLPQERLADAVKVFADLQKQSIAFYQKYPDQSEGAFAVTYCAMEAAHRLILAGKAAEAEPFSDAALPVLEELGADSEIANSDRYFQIRATVFTQRGQILALQGKHPQAVAAFQESHQVTSKRLGPNRVHGSTWGLPHENLRSAYLGKAKSLASLGKWDEAATALKEAEQSVIHLQNALTDQASTNAAARGLVQTRAEIHNDLSRALSYGAASRDEVISAFHNAAEYRNRHLDYFDDPRAYRESIAGYYDMAAILLDAQKKPAEAIADRRKAQRVREDLVRDYPGDVTLRVNMGMGHKSAALQLVKLQFALESKAEMEAASKVFSALEADFPADPRYLVMRGDLRHDMGDAYREAALRTDAIEQYQLAYAIRKQLRDSDRNSTSYGAAFANTARNLAEVHLQQGAPDSGLPLLREAIAIWKDMPIDAADYISALEASITMLDNYAWSLQQNGKAEQALPLHEEVLTHRLFIAEKFPGKVGVVHALHWTHKHLAYAHFRMGQWENAMVSYAAMRQKYLELVKLACDDHTLRGKLSEDCDYLAQTMLDAGNARAAEQVFRDVLMDRENLRNDHPRVEFLKVYVAWSHLNIGAALDASRDHADAAKEYTQGFSLLVQAYTGENRANWVRENIDKNSLRFCLASYKSQQLAATAQIAQEYLAFVRSLPIGSPPPRSETLAIGGEALLSLGKHDKAVPLLETALQNSTPTSAGWRYFFTMALLGEACRLQGKTTEAGKLLSKACDGLLARREQVGKEHEAKLLQALDWTVAAAEQAGDVAMREKYKADRGKFVPADASSP